MTRNSVVKRICIVAGVIVGMVICVIAVALIMLQVRTNAILNDISDIGNNEKYKMPVYIDGIEVIKQDVSCGYAVIEMFSAWNGQTITEESLYNNFHWAASLMRIRKRILSINKNQQLCLVSGAVDF